MHTKEAIDLQPGDRLWLADSMEFEVIDVTRRGTHDKMHGRYLDYLEIHLDDQCLTDWSDSDLLKGRQDDTGSMSICKDPTEELDVLDVGEEAPKPFWQA